MEIGATVVWENESYILPTGGSGKIVDIHESFVIVKRLDMADRYPHLNPFVTKRVWELRVVENPLEA